MSSIPQLDMPSHTHRCSQRLPMSCRYRMDHVFIPASNQKDVQDFLTNCAEGFENSKMEVAHHPTMHLISKRRVLKPRYNNGRYATQTQRNDIASRQMQKQYQNTARKPLPPVYEEDNSMYEPNIYDIQPPNIFESEYNENNLISIPQSIRIRMYHRNEMIQPHTNEDETEDQQLNNDTIDQDLPIPPYEEYNENANEEIDEKEIDQAADYTESINENIINDAQNTVTENTINDPPDLNTDVDNQQNDNTDNTNLENDNINPDNENNNTDQENENNNAEAEVPNENVTNDDVNTDLNTNDLPDTN